MMIRAVVVHLFEHAYRLQVRKDFSLTPILRLRSNLGANLSLTPVGASAWGSKLSVDPCRGFGLGAELLVEPCWGFSLGVQTAR